MGIKFANEVRGELGLFELNDVTFAADFDYQRGTGRLDVTFTDLTRYIIPVFAGSVSGIELWP